MKRVATFLTWAALLATPLAACNDVGDCNGQSVKPGGSCSGDQLECAYTVQNAPSPACDGTLVEGGLQTSCTCISGAWSCPSVSCDAAAGGDDAGDASSGNDAQGGDAADGQASTEAGADSAKE